ncbi:hypothetical protein EPUL_004933 [Erysiphe pulchra]|uniref:Uncharacterized protein n=1 Tax=Erysiphe pulchra TaxID=225359 RepID=A0A2S4PKE1_9PEZI|nr:hypothetical protein EPUL_004933 [Erysiphe pulchra]
MCLAFEKKLPRRRLSRAPSRNQECCQLIARMPSCHDLPMFVGQQGKFNGRKRRHDENESEQPSQPTDLEHDNTGPETNCEAAILIKELRAAHEPLLKADHQEFQLVNSEACVAEQRMRRTKAWKTTQRSRGINVGKWKAKISEKEKLENAKAIREVEIQIQIVVKKAQKLLIITGVQARKNEKYSSDIEISLSTQYLDPVASSFYSECKGDDQDQDHLRADVESLAGLSRPTSPIDHTANFISLCGSDDMYQFRISQ